jgi:uncharacterized protein with WD repeat
LSRRPGGPIVKKLTFPKLLDIFSKIVYNIDTVKKGENKMRVSNTNVKHIRFSDSDEYLFSIMDKIVDEIRETMRKNDCDLMYNTQTGEIIALDEFDRMAGILSGLGDMDEILKE